MSVEERRAVRRSRRERLPIVGITLDAAALKKIPKERRFPYSALNRRAIRDVWHVATLKYSVAPPVYQCPTCKVGVTSLVIHACSVAPTGRVAVQCVNKHWARYPCLAP